MTTEQTKKKSKLRYAEYYDFQCIQDRLYADSGKGKKFNKLIELIVMPENICLAYYRFNINLNSNGSPNRGNKYAALRRSNLKEIAFVRYADDFKIFTTSYQNAVKLFHATKN